MSSQIRTIIEDDPASMAKRAARIFLDTANVSVRERGRFFVAFSGGSTPLHMYRFLAEKPYRTACPWDLTHVYQVDERCVGVDDPASNFGALNSLLLKKVPIPIEQIHRMPIDLPPKKGAREYEEILGRVPQEGLQKVPVFDLIFLGLGSDGHVASLFPGQASLEEKDHWVLYVKGGNPNVDRMTLTLPILNNARITVVMAAGAEKAKIVSSALNDEKGDLPIHHVRPFQGELIWLFDRESAALL